MVGAIEGDAHVSAGSARARLLGRGRRGAASACGTAGNSARRAADEANQSAFEGEHASAAQGDHQASVIDEMLNLREAFVADASRDVVGLGGSSETGSLCSFLEGHRGPGL